MDFDSNEEEDFLTTELNDPLWFEEPISGRQHLCIHLILHQSITNHTPRLATQPPRPTQEEALPETELMDALIMDDLLDIIDVPHEELYSDFDS